MGGHFVGSHRPFLLPGALYNLPMTYQDSREKFACLNCGTEMEYDWMACPKCGWKAEDSWDEEEEEPVPDEERPATRLSGSWIRWVAAVLLTALAILIWRGLF